MRQVGLGVVYDGASLLIPVEGAKTALRVSLKDPTIPKSIRSWISENLSALESLLGVLSSTREAWVRIPMDGEWTYL